MKKTISLFILCFFFIGAILRAQTEECGASGMHQQLLKTDPEYARKHQEFEKAML